MNLIYPDIIIRKGIGIFFNEKISFESPFEIIHYPETTIIKAETNKKYIDCLILFSKDYVWEMNGFVEDRVKVSANNLTLLDSNKLIFNTFKDLYFGEKQKEDFSFAEFPLVGFYQGKIDLVHNDWQIKSVGQEDETSVIKAKSEYWNLQLEGFTLKLINNKANLEEYVSKAEGITSLLSLAFGNDIVFNRQLFFRNENLVSEIWRRKVDYHFGAEQCIPDFVINDFINITLENYEKWDDKKKKLFYSTVNYINSSSKGFLEDRLLRICIAWEGLVQGLSKKIKTSDIELNQLKEFLKKSIDGFDLSVKFDKDFIRERILNSLDWEKLSESLINLCDQYRLNQEKIGLDFKSLIKMRNDVAHSGQFRQKYNTDFISEILYNHKFGLQLLLLRELGYDGIVESQENNWRTLIKIDDYFI